MVTGMEHVNQQHQAGDTYAACKELAAARRETSHSWNLPAIDTTHPPITAGHLGEAHSVAAQQNTPATDLITLAVDDTLHVTLVANDPLTVLRQNLTELAVTGDATSRTLRDIIDPTRRIGVDV
jgi:hypothetical protein